MRLLVKPVAALGAAVVFLSLLALLVWTFYGTGSDEEDALDGALVPGSDASGPPGGDTSPEFLFAIENPELDCRSGSVWLTVRAIGPSLDELVAFNASPLTPDVSEGSFTAVGRLRSLDANVTSIRRAADVIGERDYLDDSIMATVVEAELPAFLTESDYREFQVVLTSKLDDADPGGFSNALRLETAAASC